MKRNLSLIALAATALAACNSEPETLGGDDPEAVANGPAVELPPAIAASKTYRCKDNSVVRIDWLSDNSAYVHGDGQAQTHVKPVVPAEGQPASAELVAEGGFALTGDAAAASVSVTLPGKGKVSCHG